MDKVFIIGKDTVPELIKVATGQNLRLTFVAMPGVSAKVRNTIEIDGSGADVDIAGVYLCSGTDRLEIDITIRHLCTGSTSRQLFKGIVGDQARASFNGLVYVARDAQKTQAFQASHSILLSDKAQVSSQPMLEIYADDVQCSHGSTSGFLDANELFYMRSRGIPEEEAKYLQKLAFIAPVASRLSEDLAEQVYASIK